MRGSDPGSTNRREDLQLLTYPWMKVACAELAMDIRAARSARAAARVVDYFKYVKLYGQERSAKTPWCSAFANWCVVNSGAKGTGLSSARSWLEWGVPVSSPMFGSLVILTRPSAENPKAGHVGFFVRQDQAGLWLLGGNQSNAVSIQPFEKSKLLGYRVDPKFRPEAA